ncbi:MAG: ABC transporter permease [Candidatus Dormibacteria bacterium]|jgi:ribose/xylose/arabinose/galactoside ABC-type transport system permease subunit
MEVAGAIGEHSVEDVRPVGRWRSRLRAGLPGVAFVLILGACFALEPTALSYRGVGLLLSPAVPLIFAAMSVSFVILVGDIDLGLGYAVGLSNVIIASWLVSSPWLAVAGCVGLVVAYGLIGALVHVRRVPAIVATLGASFVWLGLGLTILPIPGGSAPSWLTQFFSWQPPLIPLPIVLAAVVALIGYFLCYRWPFGVVLRGAGGSPDAARLAGWSMLRIRVVAYLLAGAFGVLAGLALTGITASGDVTASANFTLLAIASVILGGAEFAGGVAAPVGTVLGAMTISLTGTVLGFLNVSSDFDTGAQGLILIIVLGGRVFMRRRR